MVRVADIISAPQLEMEDGLDCGVEVLIWRALFSFGELFHWELAFRNWKQFGVSGRLRHNWLLLVPLLHRVSEPQVRLL